MLKLQSELTVHKGNVFSFLCVVGGVLMTVTAGGRCVDVAVSTVSHPANLRRLSDALIRLLGLRVQIHAAIAKSKPRIKKLYFTDSFNSLLYTTGLTLSGRPELEALRRPPAEVPTNLQPTSTNCVSVRRQGIYYILVCSVSSWTVVTLFMGNNSSELRRYKPSNQLQWLISFSCKALARGDTIFLLRTGHTGQISTASATNEERGRLSLTLSAVCGVFLWMFVSNIALFAVICLSWMIQEHIHRLCRCRNALNKECKSFFKDKQQLKIKEKYPTPSNSRSLNKTNIFSVR